MVGASIYVVPIMIQRNVPGIGPYVLPAFLVAAVPAIFAALAYSILASAMPRAGGSYLYASRGLHPYLGFVASFSQWFGLSIAIGVVAYVIVPFLRDIASALAWTQSAALLNTGWLRILIALALVWLFVLVNIRGLKAYERTIIPLMAVMFFLGMIVIIAGSIFSPADFAYAYKLKEGKEVVAAVSAPFQLPVFLSAAAVLFSSFIGFDSIAQAGGEAENPKTNLPLATGIAVATVTLFYLLFASSIYSIVPWNFIAEQAQTKDVTAPGLLGYLLPSGWTIALIAGAAVALTNDLPAMLLSVSRLVFAWAEDGIFPKPLATVHPKFNSPVNALLMSGTMASVSILGCHFAGDFFLGIDIMVTSMLVNFLFICLAVINLKYRNPELAAEIKFIRSRPLQILLAVLGMFSLGLFLVIHIRKDFTTQVTAWYFQSTYLWLIVVAIASLVYWRELYKLTRKGANIKKIFSQLPPQ